MGNLDLQFGTAYIGLRRNVTKLVAKIGKERLSALAHTGPGKKLDQFQKLRVSKRATRFLLTRKMNIFTSRVQYVEFSVSNYQLTTRQIPLPPELVDVADDDLKNRITSRIRAPFDGIGKLEIKLDPDGKSETIQVDDQWLKKERKRIEDEYTFQINNFGRVILYSDRVAFDKAISRFQTVIEKYLADLRKKLSESRAAFETRIVGESGQAAPETGTFMDRL